MGAIEFILALIGAGGLGGLISAVIAGVIQWRKAPHETLSINGSAAKSFADAGKVISDTVPTYLKRIGDLECDNGKLKDALARLEGEFSKMERHMMTEIERLDRINTLYGRTLSDWMVGIQKDIDQLLMIGIKPAWMPIVPSALRAIWLAEARDMTSG